MSGNLQAMLVFKIKNAITNYFSPAINLIDIILEPDYSSRIYNITVSYSSKLSTKVEQVQLATKDILGISEQMNTDIAYVGENLYMFCLMQKPNMSDNQLVYDDVNEIWTWGKWTMTNFTTEDTFFTEILNACNG